ncbi:MAG: response regulator [Desertifilum sp. SIO1I2]|nr:response regulator [Desertifilum sp. SIO1I2]
MRLLVVEDDLSLAQAIVKFLTYQNYVVDTAPDGQIGWEFAQSCAYDLVVLDIILPKLGGISLCQKLRQTGCDTPILLLTACGSKNHKVEGLEAGADDYVTKPFDWQELLARIRALLRRKSDLIPALLTWGDLILNSLTCEVTYGNTKLPLRPKEYKLLELFLRSPNRILSCDAILEYLWSFEQVPSQDAVRAHIKGLRQKLKAVGAQDAIETVYGLGYRLRPIVQRLPNVETPPLPLPPEIQGELQQALADAWQDVQSQILERVHLLEIVIYAMPADKPLEKLRQVAIAQAHKLAGTVGSYGFMAASHQAQQIEAQLQHHPLLSEDIKSQLQQGVLRLRQLLQGAPAIAHQPPAAQDALTQLASRIQFTRDFEQLLNKAQQHHQPLTLVLLRIENLKSLNHQYGYAFGDRLLYSVSSALGDASQTCGRWGSRTFAIALYGMNGTQTRHQYLSKLLQTLDATEGTPVIVKFTSAIATYPTDGQTSQHLYQSVESLL